MPFLVGFSVSYRFLLLFHLEKTLQHFFNRTFSMMNYFSFSSSEKYFISSSILNDNLSGQNILVCRIFPFSTLYYAIPSWPAKFLQRKLVAFWGFPCTWLLVFLLLPLVLSFYLSLLPFRLVYVLMWVCLGSFCLGLSMLPVAGYVFPSSSLWIF